MMNHRKTNPYLEQRTRERERITNSPTLAEKYRNLKSLQIVLEYFDRQRTAAAGELRYRANVQHAKSIVHFACPNSSCKGGGFDLSDVIAAAITKKRKSAEGDLCCAGTLTFASKKEAQCQHLVRYRFTFGYA